ncbi:MAG: aldo/keto reductase [Candidatus Omnitrophica bacterium]|nr:aldo/keto reductase [Candidatus Omnitrophota bacterium]
MKYFPLRNSDIQISRIALGTWVFGGTHWGGSKQTDCIKAVHAAIDLGINLIDTAPIYGAGISETIIGKAIQNKRSKVILANKCGLLGKGKNITNNLTAKSIFTEIEGSLQRLKTDYIDIYQCHWPDPNTPLKETMTALAELKKQGKIRYIGVSNFNNELLEEAEQYAEITTLQNHYSILDREIETNALPYCRKHNINVLCYGPLAGGILSGKYTEPPTLEGSDARNFFYKYYKGEKFEQVTKLLEKLREFKRPLNQIAINWLLAQSGVSSVLVGARNAEQVKQNVEATTWTLSDNEIKIIKQNTIC